MERDFLRAFLSIFGTRVGILVIGLLTTPLIVRLLGSGGYGDYALVMSVFSVLTVFTNSGIFNGIRKYIAEDRSIEEWTDIVFSFYFKFSVLVTAGLAVVLMIVSQSALVADLLDPDFQTYFVVLGVYLFVSQFYSMGRGALMGFGLEHYSEPLRMAEKVVYAVVALILLYYGLGVTGLLTGHIVGILLAGMAAFWLIKEKISFRMLTMSTPETISRYDLLTFNVYSILLAFLTISLYNVDILLLRPLAGDSETGFYRASLVVAEFLWMVPVAIQYTLVQSTSEMWSKNQHKRITDVASTATRINLSLIVIMGIGLAALADEFVPLYFGQDFTPAVGPLLLLLPGVLGLALSKPIFAIGQGKGELRALVLTTGAAAFLNLVLNILLIPRYGMYGAAVATSIGYGCMFFLHTWTAHWIGFDPIDDLRATKIMIAALVATPVVFGLATVLPGLIALAVVPPAGFLAYAITSLRIGVIDVAEIKHLQDRSPKVVDPIYRVMLRLCE